MELGVNILVESGVDGYNVPEQRRMRTERAAVVVVYSSIKKKSIKGRSVNPARAATTVTLLLLRRRCGGELL